MPERTTDHRTHRAASSAELHAPAKPAVSTAREATRATTAGTRRFAERSAERLAARRAEFHRILPRRLTVSALGLGTYLGDCTDEVDHAYASTVRAAIADGVNLIDT